MLSHCGNELMKWNRASFGNVQRKKVKDLKKDFATIQEKERSDANVELEIKASKQIAEWLAREELLTNNQLVWIGCEGRPNYYILQSLSHIKKESKVYKEPATVMK